MGLGNKDKLTSNVCTKSQVDEHASVNYNFSKTKCLCERPRTNILCTNCGNVMFGRVRHQCPDHDRVSFLCDINNCTKCMANEYLLQEIDEKYIDSGSKINN